MTVSYEAHGSGPAIIFLHGVGSGKEGWHHQIASVVEAGWHFVAIDAPGFGTTPPPDVAGFMPHIDSIVEVMDALAVDSATLCGHSLGGMTAQEFYAHYPKRVDGMVLSATSPAFGRPDGEFQKEFLRQRFEPFDQGLTMPEFANRFASGLVGPNAKQQAVDEIINIMSGVSIEAYRQAMRTITVFDQRANLPHIDVPTLLIAGEADQNSPAKMMEKMASKISGAEFVELANTGHMAPVENANKFNTVLLKFLNRLKSR